jgi:uncharacterized membrane protein (DUF106 family)
MALLPYQEIFLWSIGLSLLMTIISKFLANQQEMRRAKKDMAFYREKATKAQKSGDLKKANEYTSEMLKASQKQFRQNLKPMMLSFLIFIIALGWLGSAYGDVVVSLSNSTNLLFTYQGVSHKMQLEGNLTKVDLNLDGQFSQEEALAQGSVFSYGGMDWKVDIVPDKEIRLQAIVAQSPFTIPFIGSELNWFWLYIIIVLPLSMVFRKLLNVA